MLNTHTSISLPLDHPPQLIVVVDTEEEFDWFADPNRESNSVSHMNSIHLVQDIFNEYGIQPCYVIDYAIASQKESVDVLKDFLDKDLCEIGAHLHPWVNPPFDEELSRSNMYPGNLTEHLEYEKLKNLSNSIKQSFGLDPHIYKAGRYGVGLHTTKIMNQLGYDIDLSICSAFDYRLDGGPDFTKYTAQPYWFGPDNSMLEIPLSGAFVGIDGLASPIIYNLAQRFKMLKAPGVLSRLGIVDRLMLSPEGYSSSEHQKLTQYLYNRGVRTFTWNFHSPTVVPGMTMYTQSDQDVREFLDTFRRYFDYFFGKLRGKSITPTSLKAQLEKIK